MWKIALAFAVFAGLALYLLSKGPAIDMSGEKHGSEATHASEVVAPAASAALAAPAAASAAK